MWYAIDFGTSNSLLSYVREGQEPKLIDLENGKPILRSLIFTPEKNTYFFGDEAIEKYEELAGEGRFFRSLKKFLPEPSFKGTELFGRRISIEELIATFLREMKKRADEATGEDVVKVVLGRPALYSLDPERDQLAENRMRAAATLSGFTHVEFCPEPVAAGLDVQNEKEQNVLVCDFGGGTSDFTLLKSGSKFFSKEDVLGLSGVFVAGDAFDGRIMRNFISEHFGKNVKYKAPMGKNTLSFPNKLLKKLCNPAHIIFLKERENWEFLKELEQWSVGEENQKYFSQLFCLVEEQLGYPVYAQIEKTKIDLGKLEKSVFHFDHPGVQIEMPIERLEFENAVEGELASIFDSLDKVFEQSSLEMADIDLVRITGGTGQMPLVQSKLQSLFGEEKIEMNDVFQSVVNGLGKYAQNLL